MLCTLNLNKRGDVAVGLTWIPATIVIFMFCAMMTLVSIELIKTNNKEIGANKPMANDWGYDISTTYNLGSILMTPNAKLNFKDATIYDYIQKSSDGETIFFKNLIVAIKPILYRIYYFDKGTRTYFYFSEGTTIGFLDFLGNAGFHSVGYASDVTNGENVFYYGNNLKVVGFSLSNNQFKYAGVYLTKYTSDASPDLDKNSKWQE